MVIHRPDRGGEAAGDLGIGEPVGEQQQHLELTVGEPGHILAGRSARASRNLESPLLAQFLSQQVCCRSGTQLFEEGQGLVLSHSVALS